MRSRFLCFFGDEEAEEDLEDEGDFCRSDDRLDKS